ncbi:MAG: BrxA family protein [Bacteroidales bacterium]
MKINSDINILGSLPDWNLINVFLEEDINSVNESGGIHSYTSIKTDKSVKRFQRVINSSLIKFNNPEIESLTRSILKNEKITKDSLLFLFWNTSFNNELLEYLNTHLYFISFYSGRITIKQDEVVACLKDLRERESELKKWSDSTLLKTASKYLTLLKKFNLMEGSQNKTILHPYLSDKMFLLFVYWLNSEESKSNLLESQWIQYCFCERTIFIERLMQKNFSKYYQFTYTGDNLKIETLIPYKDIYYAVK